MPETNEKVICPVMSGKSIANEKGQFGMVDCYEEQCAFWISVFDTQMVEVYGCSQAMAPLMTADGYLRRVSIIDATGEFNADDIFPVCECDRPNAGRSQEEIDMVKCSDCGKSIADMELVGSVDEKRELQPNQRSG